MELDKGLGYRFSWSTQNPESDNARILLNAGQGDRSYFEAANNILRGFPVVWKYYELIGDANVLSPEDPRVHANYWIGGDLLDAHYDMIDVHDFMLQTFPNKFGDNSPEMPQGVPPHHNLHVFRYGIVSKPDATQDETDACLVVPGRVDEGGLVKSTLDGSFITAKNTFGFELESGLYVATHRGEICVVGNKELAETVELYGYLLQRDVA